MEIESVSPFQYIRIKSLENAVNQLSPNDTVESILTVAQHFERYILTGNLPPSSGNNVVSIPRHSTGINVIHPSMRKV